MAIKIHRIPAHTPEWHEFRKNGIGGSEMGTVLGSNFNEYGSRIKLFYEKARIVEPNMETSEVMRHGQLLEDYIVEKWWSHFDGDIESTMRNQDSNKKVRKCMRINGYGVNDKYPWLFGSLDRMIIKGEPMLIEDEKGGISLGESMEKNGVLECKTINGFVARKYEGQIPPYQIIQVQQYMTIFELEYSEFGVLQDGRQFYCMPMLFSQNVSDMIIERSFDFWHNHVLPAKELYPEYQDAHKKGNVALAEKIQGRIHQYEPPADSSDLTREFISSRFVEKHDVFSGDVSMLAQAIEYKRLSKIMNGLKDRKDTIYNSLMNTCVHQGCNKIELPGGHYVKMFRKEGSKNNQLTFSVRHESIEKADDKVPTI